MWETNYWADHLEDIELTKGVMMCHCTVYAILCTISAKQESGSRQPFGIHKYPTGWANLWLEMKLVGMDRIGTEFKRPTYASLTEGQHLQGQFYLSADRWIATTRAPRTSAHLHFWAGPTSVLSYFLFLFLFLCFLNIHPFYFFHFIFTFFSFS